jgi:predicted DsbA family dithiol-disulfide isomerase
VEVEVWSDVVCPWCYIGKRRLDEAIARFESPDQIEVRWRSFELDPHAPPVRTESNVERLARKYSMPVEQAAASQRRVAQIAADHGVTMRFDLAKGGNTFDAHRLLHAAAEHGVQAELAERLMTAHFTDGRAIGDPATLASVAAEAGLDPDLVRKVLEGDAYADDVRADERLARDYDITGVPFFVIDGKYAVAGAQRADVLLDALEQAWSERD